MKGPFEAQGKPLRPTSPDPQILQLLNCGALCLSEITGAAAGAFQPCAGFEQVALD